MTVTNDVLEMGYTLLEKQQKIKNNKITDPEEIAIFNEQKAQFKKDYPELFSDRLH